MPITITSESGSKSRILVDWREYIDWDYAVYSTPRSVRRDRLQGRRDVVNSYPRLTGRNTLDV